MKRQFLVTRLLLDSAKEKGVRDRLAFHKKRGLAQIEDMVEPLAIYLACCVQLHALMASRLGPISCLNDRLWLGREAVLAHCQGLRLVLRWFGLQPGALRTPQAGIARSQPRAIKTDHVRILPRTPTATTTYYHVEKMPLRNQKSNQPRTRRLWPAQDPGKTPRLWTDTG